MDTPSLLSPGKAGRTVVHLDRVSKRYGPVVAVDGLDIRIRAGEFVTFLGPSGCGKSTTLRILGGFERPTEGRVILGGEDVTLLPPNKRRVNMVFQDYALFPHLTVARNIAFGLELKGLPRAAINARLDELMGFLELGSLRDRRPDQLSGGQRQRVALARALAPDPELLLLDEPLGALDAKLRGQVQRELKDIQRRTGTTFFFVTHDQDEALTMSDRIVVMNAGRVEQDGTPEELYARPLSRFVAEFIGETNLLPGTAIEVRGSEVVVDWFGRSLIGWSAGPPPRTGETVTVALRPEAVTLSTLRPANRPSLPGRIVERVFKGSHSVVDVRVGERQDEIVRAYANPTTAAVDTRSGEVWLSWSPSSVTVVRN